MAARQGLRENCQFLLEHTGGSIANELDNQVITVTIVTVSIVTLRIIHIYYEYKSYACQFCVLYVCT